MEQSPLKNVKFLNTPKMLYNVFPSPTVGLQCSIVLSVINVNDKNVNEKE